MPSRFARLPPPFWYFLLLAVAMRWGSFFVSVVNSDESTYIVIADELLRGGVYLRDVVDTKPVGIFWLYAVFIKLTGGSIPLLRLVASGFVALGAWLLGIVSWRVIRQPAGAYVAGTVYCLMCSVYKFYGVSPNTEIYFNVCTIGAVALTVVAARRRWFWGGLLLGLGFVIKPFVAAEALAVGLYLVWRYRGRWDELLSHGLALVGGFALPVMGTIGYYAQLDLLPELWFYGVEVARAYPTELSGLLKLKYMGDYLLRYAPLLILGGVALVRSTPDRQQKEWLAYLALQFVLVTAVVLLTGNRFGHYQVQLHPVVALAVGTLVGRAWPEVMRRRRWLPGVVLVGALVIGAINAVYYAKKQDTPAALAAYFAERLEPEQQVLGQSHQIVYHLVDRSPPLPYVHPSLVFTEHLRSALGVDVEALAQRLVANPRLVYFYGAPPEEQEAEDTFTERLLPYFEEVYRLPAGTVIYRRITPSPVSSTEDRSVKRDR